MRNWILTLALFLVCKVLAAQTVLVPQNGTLYWVGRASSGTTVQVGGLNYNVNANSWYHPENWSTSSGGSSSANLYPGSNTDVIFDGNSLSHNCQVQASSSAIGMPYVKSLTLETSYLGSISSNTTYRYRIGSKLEIKGGTFNAPFNVNTSNAGISLDNGADFILSGGTFNMPAVFQMGDFNGINKSEFIVQGGTLNNAVVAFNSASVDVNLNSNQSTLFTTNGSTITLSNGYALYNLVLSAFTGINSDIVVKNRLGVRTGGASTLVNNFNGYTITVGESVANNTNSLTFGSITNPSHLASPSSADNGYWLFSNGTIKVVKGNVYLNNGAGTSISLGSSSGILEIAGNQDQYLNNVQAMSGTLALGFLPNLVVNKPSGTLHLQGAISARGNFILTQGTVNPGTSTVQFRGPANTSRYTSNLGNPNAMPFNNLSVYEGELILAEATKILGDLAIYKKAKFICDASEDPLYLFGNLYVDNTNITLPVPQAAAVFSPPTLDFTFMDGVNQSITFTNGSGVGVIPNLSVKNIVTLISDLEISNNLQIESTGTLNLGNRSLSVKGSTINNGTINASTATIQFSGVNQQAWNNPNGTEQTIGNVVLNNTNGLVLNSPIRVNTNLNLLNGKITTTATNLLTLADGATISNYNNTNYIVGPLRKIGDDFATTFTFPVGSATSYKPVTLSEAINTDISDEFTVTYFQSTPPTPTVFASGSNLNSINNHEYWDIHRSAGASTALKVELPWVESDGIEWAPSVTTIVHYNGTSWEKPSPVTVTGSSVAGTVKTNDRVSSFSEWTSGEGIIVMPVTFLDLKGKVSVVNQYELTWATATELNNEKFILEKSIDGQTFETITEIQGSGNANTRKEYQYVFHTNDYYSKLYFRLSQQDFDGTRTFLKLILVDNLKEDNIVYPNLLDAQIQTTLHLRISEKSENLDDCIYMIYDLSGKLISQDMLGISKTINVCLSKGTYVLRVTSGAGVMTSKLFVR